MKTTKRKRRDWIFILLIILAGVLLMLIAGQKATRLAPRWGLRANMRSNLDPNNRYLGGPESGGVGPLDPKILTPAVWNDTYLTPMPEEDEPVDKEVTLVVFDPSATPSVTPTPSTSPTPSPSPTVTTTTTATPSPSPTVVVTVTKRKKKHDPPPPPPPSPTPVISTLDPALVEISPTPANFNVGAPDGSVASPADGSYFVADLGANPVVVNGPADTNYDLAYYELNNCAGVCMDQVSLGISQQSDGSTYYEVFNWGDGVPDTNSNVDTGDIGVDPAEIDNQSIPAAELYGTPPTQTGILIDVDNAPSNPPPDTYQYVVVIAPSPTTGNDGADVDAIEVVDVPPP